MGSEVSVAWNFHAGVRHKVGGGGGFRFVYRNWENRPRHRGDNEEGFRPNLNHQRLRALKVRPLSRLWAAR